MKRSSQVQVVCSSPLFCKSEPESPASSWDPVDFTESSFGEYWTEDWLEDEKVTMGNKNFAAGETLLMDMDLDLIDGSFLMKEESFTWIDERNDGLYSSSSFDWSANNVKTATTPLAVSVDQKPFDTNNSNDQKPFIVGIDQKPFSNGNGITDNGKLYQHQENIHCLLTPSALANAVEPTTATPDLLREFEDVLINTTTGSLTPPESPRDNLITLLQEIEPCSSSSNEIDAIVATQAENMVPHSPQNHHNHQTNPSQHSQQQQQQQQQQLAPLSPDSWSSPSTGGSSGSSSSSDSGYDDPDWSPSPPPMILSNSTLTDENATTISSTTRRKRAAASTTEERKMRKKEQNKNAATRYRQKKKLEIEEIIGEERELLDKHEQLKAEVTEVTREIRYLKSLLRDLYKAKGLIK